MRTLHEFLICTFIMCMPAVIAAENIWEDDELPASSSDEMTENAAVAADVSSTQQQADQDATCTIKKGDTLWDLAFQFLGNPFEWQRIWEVNPYIKNPDLIYPGDRLVIPGRGKPVERRAIPANLIPSETLGALSSDTGSTEEMAYPGDLTVIHSLRNKNVLSKGQLQRTPFLWTERNARGQIFPGNGKVRPPKNGTAYQLFSKVSVSLYKSAQYSVGDTVAIYRSIRFVEFKGKTANLVQHVGSGVVQEVDTKKMTLLLYEMSESIRGNERVAPLKKTGNLVIDTLVEAETSISAEVFIRVEQTETPYPFQMCILNKGSTHGVTIGDVFAVFSSDNSQLSVIGMIVHAGEESSTLCMVYMRQNRVEAGDAARLVRRASFLEEESATNEDAADDTEGETITQD